MEDGEASREESLKVSESLWLFESEITRQLNFLKYTLVMAKLLDDTFVPMTIEVLKRELNSPGTDPDMKTSLEEIKSNYEALPKVRDRLVNYAGLMTEATLIRSVDGFLLYLSDVLSEALRLRPEMLKSSDTITIAEVLDRSSMDELINYATERKVTAISMKGAKDLIDYVRKQYGFVLFPDNADRNIALTMIEWRNLLVHNHGVVNSLFLSRVPSDDYVLGEPLHLERENVWEKMDRLRRYAHNIDQRAVAKWNLATPRIITRRLPNQEA